MNAITPIVLLLGIFALGSCASMSPDQRSIVDAARTIDRYPVSRTNAIRKLGLYGLPSKRYGNVVNSGYVFTESWAHASGLFVAGHDAVPFEYKVLTRRDIDRLLMLPFRSDRACCKDASIPRPTFQRIVVTTSDGELVFDSELAKKSKDEQIMDANLPIAPQPPSNATH